MRTYPSVDSVRCCVIDGENSGTPRQCNRRPLIVIEGNVYCGEHAPGGLSRLIAREEMEIDR